MIENVAIAKELGYLKIKPGRIKKSNVPQFFISVKLSIG
jgi:hypothetical protein